MDSINLGPSRLAREAQAPISTVADLLSGRNQNPSYRLVVAVYAALVRRGLDVGRWPLATVFPIHEPESVSLVGASATGTDSANPDGGSR